MRPQRRAVCQRGQRARPGLPPARHPVSARDPRSTLGRLPFPPSFADEASDTVDRTRMCGAPHMDVRGAPHGCAGRPTWMCGAPHLSTRGAPARGRDKLRGCRTSVQESRGVRGDEVAECGKGGGSPLGWLLPGNTAKMPACQADLGWRPPPGASGNCLEIRATGLARDLLGGWLPVRVRIAPARCLTGWTRDGRDCPGGLASAGSPWVSVLIPKILPPNSASG